MAILGIDYRCDDETEDTLVIEDVDVNMPLKKAHRLICLKLYEHGIELSRVLRCYYVYSFTEASM